MHRLPKQFWVLAGGVFLFLVGYELGYPFESVYLHNRLDISMSSVGLIVGLPVLAGLPAQIIAGAIADHCGRRGVLLLGICASAATLSPKADHTSRGPPA
jgi:MFS family permease